VYSGLGHANKAVVRTPAAHFIPPRYRSSLVYARCPRERASRNVKHLHDAARPTDEAMGPRSAIILAVTSDDTRRVYAGWNRLGAARSLESRKISFGVSGKSSANAVSKHVPTHRNIGVVDTFGLAVGCALGVERDDLAVRLAQEVVVKTGAVLVCADYEPASVDARRVRGGNITAGDRESGDCPVRFTQEAPPARTGFVRAGDGSRCIDGDRRGLGGSRYVERCDPPATSLRKPCWRPLAS
jgi:hypothetical protein